MYREITLYLAGKIQKAHENPNETYRTEQDQEVLRKALFPATVHFTFSTDEPGHEFSSLTMQMSIWCGK